MEERQLTTMERVLLNHIADLLADSRTITESDSNYRKFNITHDEAKEDEFYKLVNELLASFDFDLWVDNLPTFKEADEKSREFYKRYMESEVC